MSQDTDLKAIEHLDFVAELPCESPRHGELHGDQPARWALHLRCPLCGAQWRLLWCDEARRRARPPGGIRHKQGTCNRVFTWEEIVVSCEPISGRLP